MDSSGSFIITLLDRVRTYIDEPDAQGKFTDDYLIRHFVMPAMREVWDRITLSASSVVIVKYDVTLDPDRTRYPLPACAHQVLRVVGVDADGVATQDWVPASVYRRQGANWRLEGQAGSLELVWDTTVPSVTTSAQVWYVPNGDLMVHYSADGGVVTDHAFTGGSWAESTLTLTKVGAFANYSHTEGDQITLTANTGGSTGQFEVASRVDDDSVILATSPGSGSGSIAGRIWARTLTLENAPDYGGVDRRANAYLGQVLRILPASPGRIFEVQVASQAVTAAGAWSVTTRHPFDAGASPSAVPYEVAPAGSQGLWEAVALRATMKLALARRWPQSGMEMLRREYMAAMKTAGDNAAQLESRLGKFYKVDTVDNPNQRALVTVHGVIDHTI